MLAGLPGRDGDGTSSSFPPCRCNVAFDSASVRKRDANRARKQRAIERPGKGHRHGVPRAGAPARSTRQSLHRKRPFDRRSAAELMTERRLQWLAVRVGPGGVDDDRVAAALADRAAELQVGPTPRLTRPGSKKIVQRV